MLNYDVILSGVGAFDHLFGPGREEFSKNFPKIQMPGRVSRGDQCSSFDLTGTLCKVKLALAP